MKNEILELEIRGITLRQDKYGDIHIGFYDPDESQEKKGQSFKDELKRIPANERGWKNFVIKKRHNPPDDSYYTHDMLYNEKKPITKV